MTGQALDQLARRVILDTARLEYGALLKEAPEHSFSPSFERKMKRLLRRGRHPVWYKALHAAACLLLALLLSGCAVLAVSPASREAFAGWVREVHDTYFSYQYVGPDQDVQEDLTKIPADFPPLLSCLQTVVDFPVLHTRRTQSGRVIRFPVRTDLAAGALRLTRSDMIAVAGVVPGGQQKISSTVVAATGCVAHHQPPVEIRIEKVEEITKLHLFRQEDFSCLHRMWHRAKAKLCRKALAEFLFREKQFSGGCHVGKVGGVGFCVCLGIAPGKRLKIKLQHPIQLSPEVPQAL